MPALKLTFGPDPIFAKCAIAVSHFDHELITLTQDMIETLYGEKAVGIGANMIGILKRIIVIDLQENSRQNPKVFINPHIIEMSGDIQCHEEASICFPGISARIPRPQSITLTYQDTSGTAHQMTAEGYLAAVIQHEIDYLNGRIFLDYLSPMKRKMLLKKTKKFQKQHDLG